MRVKENTKNTKGKNIPTPKPFLKVFRSTPVLHLTPSRFDGL